jgi:hypothetical protein
MRCRQLTERRIPPSPAGSRTLASGPISTRETPVRQVPKAAQPLAFIPRTLVPKSVGIVYKVKEQVTEAVVVFIVQITY